MNVEKIKNGVEIGMDNRLIEAARKFMLDNGYKIDNPAAKRIACSDISQLVEDEEESSALQTAIMML